jgi:hypothetical protein
MSEAEVKAGVIYHLLLFVTWPESALAQRHRLCVLGEGALANALTRHAGRTVQGRLLDVQPLATPLADTRGCTAVAVEAGQPGVVERLAVATREQRFLLIAEGERAIERGAMIGLAQQGGRIAFDIDHVAMKRSGLSASAKLLRLARTVRERTSD